MPEQQSASGSVARQSLTWYSSKLSMKAASLVALCRPLPPIPTNRA